MIRFNKPTIGKKDLESVLYCMITDDLTPGSHVKTFASMLGGELNLPNIALFHSYVQTFSTIFQILRPLPGDEVLLPSLSRHGVLLAILQHGLRPVLVDAGEDSLLPSPGQMGKKRSAHTCCMVLPQLFGIPHDLSPYRELDIPLVEDLDGSFGSRVDSSPVGSFGRFVTLNLNDYSMITTGNGGLLASREKELPRIVQAFRGSPSGIDYFMSDFNASLGISQLSRLKQSIEERGKIGEYYDSAVTGSECTHVGRGVGKELVYSSYVVKTATPFDECVRFFKRYGVPVRKGIEKPLHWYLELDVREFPNAEELATRLVSLPIYPGLKKGDVDNIAKGIRTIL